MDASCSDCARVLHLISQAQVVEKLLGRASAVNAKLTERVLRYVDKGTLHPGHLLVNPVVS